MELINLFSTPIWKTKIDPNSYDKNKIVQDITHNYDLEPARNQWDDISNLHHYYNDWNNDKFKKLDLSSLLSQYDSTILNFMTNFNFAKKINYSFTLENITAYKTSQNMNEHDHMPIETTTSTVGIFSCIHYINFKEGHESTSFMNPLIASAYSLTLSDMRNVVGNNDINLSSYFNVWKIDVEEDDFIIFPSYLKHGVNKTPPTDDLRICGVANIYLEKGKA